MSFLAALQILTVLPAGPTVPLPEGRGGRIAVWFPAVGLLLSGGAAAVVMVLGQLRDLGGAPHSGNDPVAVLLALGTITLLTGGLHLDGLADTCDGLGGGADAERSLTIMRDSRTGSYGVMGLVLVLGLKAALLAALPPGRWLIGLAVALTAGRWAMALSAGLGRYARPEGGLGGYFIRHTTVAHAVLAGAVPLAVLVADGAWHHLLPLGGLLGCAAALAVGAALTLFFRARLGGITGDTLGTVNEAGEVAALLALSLVVP